MCRLFNKCELISIAHWMNSQKDKNHIIMSLVAKKNLLHNLQHDKGDITGIIQHNEGNYSKPKTMPRNYKHFFLLKTGKRKFVYFPHPYLI